jgi:hypothetical protein
MQCFLWLVLFAFAVFVMMSLLRWFEQTADAVDQRQWDKVALLVAVPFSIWLYRSKVSAGRPTAVPQHEPVKGFGTLPKEKPPRTEAANIAPAPAASRLPGVTDEPPPGTPREFLGMPVIPPKAARPPRPAVDPEKLAKLKQKMREQGMLGDDQGT